MPRLSPKLLQHARSLHPLLPRVLQATRNLDAARNEFRWLKQYAISQAQDRTQGSPGWRRLLEKLCLERERGKPLQYLLGTEYFGDLELLCEPGVLIPRQETAASVTHLVQRFASLQSLPDQLRVLDLCTGSGCILLLFNHEFCQKYSRASPPLSVGVDLSTKAIELARKNRRLQSNDLDVGWLSTLNFLHGDIFTQSDDSSVRSAPTLMSVLQHHTNQATSQEKKPLYDILISNPPYISPSEFSRTTSRSVRNFEPKLALVPEAQHHEPGIDPGDVFYPRLLDIADEVKAKVILFEVADHEQAKRVASMITQQGSYANIEIWRDDPTGLDDTKNPPACDSRVKILGNGNGRSVFAWKGEATQWISQA